jgi:hypothetical protein
MTGTVTFGLYNPSSLFAGNDNVGHRDVTYATAGVAKIVLRGTLMGRVASGGTAGTPTAKAGNTGVVVVSMDGTAPVGAGAEAGTYQIVWTAATTFNVVDPNGDVIGAGTNGAGFNGELKFTVGTPSPAMIAGDTYTVVVAVVDKYVPSKAGVSDGSQIPTGIAAIDTDVTSADVISPMYMKGSFAWEQMVADASWSYAGAEAVLRQNNSQLYLKTLGALG